MGRDDFFLFFECDVFLVLFDCGDFPVLFDWEDFCLFLGRDVLPLFDFAVFELLLFEVDGPYVPGG